MGTEVVCVRTKVMSLQGYRAKSVSGYGSEGQELGGEVRWDLGRDQPHCGSEEDDILRRESSRVNNADVGFGINSMSYSEAYGNGE